MSPNCLIAISILLFAWLVTAAFLLRSIKKQRSLSDRAEEGQSALLLGLMTQKAKEARAASDTLEKIAELLNLGIVEFSSQKQKLRCNRAAEEFFEGNWGLLHELADHINKGSTTGQPSSSARTVMVGEQVLEMRQIEVDDRRLLIFTDITEGFRLARELKKKERLALLGQMSGQVAHKIKTPLSVLSGRAQMLARRLEPGTKERLQAESIFHEAKDLASEIDEIVDFYRNQEPQKREISIMELLHETARRLNGLGQECRAEVVSAEFDDGSDKMKTDPAILSNALYLVAQNSLHPESDAKNVYFFASRKISGSGDALLEITIEDDGRGIGQELKKRIFEPFFTTRQEGLGLGLFMARDLIERLGGSLELTEGKESGAAFRILLPL